MCLTARGGYEITVWAFLMTICILGKVRTSSKSEIDYETIFIEVMKVWTV